MRWADLLFGQGFGSRAECAALLAAGRVRCAGEPVHDAAAEVQPEGLAFEVDGQRWPWCEHALVLLHKPAGTECSRQPQDRPSVLSLLPAPLLRRGVQPVGRLDADTTGALLLTDDGALLHRLTHPKHHVQKVYRVTARHPLDSTAVARLESGVVLRDSPEPARALRCTLLDAHTLEMVLDEGRYHQVKRMLAAVGNRCEALHRVAFGPWTLPAALAPGQWCWAGRDGSVS